VFPELIDESFGFLIFTFEIETTTNDVLTGEFDDAASERIIMPGKEALIKNIRTIRS
jgi:hypothetical protein